MRLVVLQQMAALHMALQLAAERDQVGSTRELRLVPLHREPEIPDLHEHALEMRRCFTKNTKGKCPEHLSWTPGNNAPIKRGKPKRK